MWIVKKIKINKNSKIEIYWFKLYGNVCVPNLTTSYM